MNSAPPRTAEPSASPPSGIAGRLASRFQRNPLSPLIALVALLLGLFAVLVTPREEEPQIDVTMARVSVAFPGAAAADVQNLVARPLEQSLRAMSGVEHTSTVSRPGLALVTVQFEVGVPREQALVRLREVLDAKAQALPQGLGTLPPLVQAMGIPDVPVLGLTLWADDGRSASELEPIAHTLTAELQRVPGVRSVEPIGAPGRAVSVVIDPARLRARGLDLLQLERTVAAAQLALPAGSVLEARPASVGAAATAGSSRLVAVRTGEVLASAEDVGALVVGVHQGRPVYLREVARIEDGAAQAAQHVWFVPGAAQAAAASASQATDAALTTPAALSRPAITLALTKLPGTNAEDVTRAATARLEQLRNQVLPPDVHATVTRDDGATAAAKAQQLITKLAFATGSVILLVGLALGRREAVIVGAAVVLTLAATLFASWAAGFTLNRVSLFALIFSIGILVDDAIVVVENIHRHRALPHNAGRSLASLLPEAVDEVGGPTILATLTVIAALLPMAFVSGLMGPYMSPIPINASLGMALSLVIAFTVTPWLALRLMRDGHAADGSDPAHAHGPGRLARGLSRLFTALLAPLLASARKRWLLAAGIATALVLSVGLAGVQWVVLKMLPFDNKSSFQVVVDLPAGTPLEDTAALLQAMGAQLAREPEVRHVQGYAGTASPITFNGLVRQYALRAEPHQGDLQVTLVDKAHRHEQSHAIAQRLRPALEALAAPWGARLRVVEVPPGPPVASPIVAEVYGPDEAGRIALAGRIEQAFAATPGLTALDSSVLAESPQARLHVRRARAESLGIPVAAIAQTVQGALGGTDAAWLHDGASRVPVPVRLQLPRESQVGLDALLQLPLRAADGSLVPLSELVTIERDAADRALHTKDLLGVSYVMADVGLAPAGTPQALPDSPLYGLFAIRSRLAEAALPGSGPIAEYWIRQPADPYAGYAIKWDGEWQITYETFRDMGAAYAVGLVLIYVLVVAQASSGPSPASGRRPSPYLVPLVIMAPIPLTVIGVMPGHALLGAPFTATSMIGMIALAGIIVRNSILLVDFIEQQVAAGLPWDRAVIDAAAVRAQPIGLTALAAMVGAFFILDDPIFNGLAISLIFGIGIATLLTLVVIPVLYHAAFAPPAGLAAPFPAPNGATSPPQPKE